MTFSDLLRQNKDAIVQRWLEGVLATYPGDSPAVLSRQKDRFANPLGHSLRAGTRGIFEALLDGMDSEKIRQNLDEIIRIRAVQELSASQAVGFVFLLKEAVRAELGKSVKDPRFFSELAVFDGRVDRMALAAFDVFVQRREKVCQLRVSEVKRQVSWIVDKMQSRGQGPESSAVNPK